MTWKEEEIVRTLDAAEASLRATADDLAVRCRIVRKDRAVGLISGGAEAKARVPEGSGSRRIRRELLDEAALRMQAAVAATGSSIPTCCFNGGADVWCDIGSKAVGVGAMQARLGLQASECVHVGYQFSTSIGNDFAARLAAPTLWVAGPKETQHVLKELLQRRGISTKADKPKSWPPSTKRTSVFMHQGKLREERGGDESPSPRVPASAASEADWVRG